MFYFLQSKYIKNLFNRLDRNNIRSNTSFMHNTVLYTHVHENVSWLKIQCNHARKNKILQFKSFTFIKLNENIVCTSVYTTKCAKQ